MNAVWNFNGRHAKWEKICHKYILLGKVKCYLETITKGIMSGYTFTLISGLVVNIQNCSNAVSDHTKSSFSFNISNPAKYLHFEISVFLFFITLLI